LQSNNYTLIKIIMKHLTLILLLFSTTLISQVSGWSSELVMLEAGYPDYIECYNDTVFKSYQNQMLYVWYVDGVAVREVQFIHGLVFKKHERYLRTKTNYDGWYKVSDTVLCRTTTLYERKCLECKLIHTNK